jgi:hypothetical protein
MVRVLSIVLLVVAASSLAAAQESSGHPSAALKADKEHTEWVTFRRCNPARDDPQRAIKHVH